jgi:hypothetical protein
MGRIRREARANLKFFPAFGQQSAHIVVQLSQQIHGVWDALEPSAGFSMAFVLHLPWAGFLPKMLGAIEDSLRP